MPPRTGRPPSGNPRRNAVPIRLTDDEHALIREAADLDQKSAGEYIRTKAINAARVKVAAARRSR